MDRLLLVLAKVLEWMFLIGLAGSAIVIIFTTIEDLEVLVKPDSSEVHSD